MKAYQAPEKFLSGKIRVALVGCGGTGSYLFRECLELNSLLQLLDHDGLTVIAFDDGVVREANLGRQCFTRYELGMNKAEALIFHEHQLGHCLDWEARPVKFEPYQAQGFDVVITAVDHPYLRYQIGSYYKDNKTARTLWLDTGNDDTTGQCLLGELGNHEDKVLPTCYDLWGESYNQPDFVNTKSCSLQDALLKQRFGVNKTSARCAGQLLSNLLLTGEIDYHGVLFNVLTQVQDKIEINEEQWAMLSAA